jgi:hypothetical protein
MIAVLERAKTVRALDRSATAIGIMSICVCISAQLIDFHENLAEHRLLGLPEQMLLNFPQLLLVRVIRDAAVEHALQR